MSDIDYVLYLKVIGTIWLSIGTAWALIWLFKKYVYSVITRWVSIVSPYFKTPYRWGCQTSMLIGAPVFVILMCVGIQKFAFTLTCYSADYKCEYAFGATDAMADYMGQLVGANEGMDIVTSPRKR